MCGIAGLIHRGKSSNVGEELQNMLQALNMFFLVRLSVKGHATKSGVITSGRSSSGMSKMVAAEKPIWSM